MPKRGVPVDLPTDDRPIDRPIEGDFIVGHSELKSYRSCPLKHFWEYVEGWHKPEMNGRIPATAKGQHWHAIMQGGYKQLQRTPGDWEAASDAMWDVAEPLIERIRRHEADKPDKEGSWADALDWMLEGYVDNYAWHADRFKVQFIEHTMYARLPDTTGAPSSIVLRFTPDIVLWDLQLGHSACVDHKSTGSSLKQVDVDLDDQFGLYPWALTRKGIDVQQFYCSQAHTKKLKRHQTMDERFAWLPSYRTVAEQQAVAFDAYRTAEDVRRVYASRETPWPAPDSMNCKRFCQFMETHILVRRDARPNAAEVTLKGMGFSPGGNDYQRGNWEKDEAALAGI